MTISCFLAFLPFFLLRTFAPSHFWEWERVGFCANVTKRASKGERIKFGFVELFVVYFSVNSDMKREVQALHKRTPPKGWAPSGHPFFLYGSV